MHGSRSKLYSTPADDQRFLGVQHGAWIFSIASNQWTEQTADSPYLGRCPDCSEQECKSAAKELQVDCTQVAPRLQDDCIFEIRESENKIMKLEVALDQTQTSTGSG